MCLLGVGMTFRGNSLCLLGPIHCVGILLASSLFWHRMLMPRKKWFTFSYFLLLLNEHLASVVHACVTFRMNCCNVFYLKGCKKVKMKAVADSSCSSSPVQKWTHKAYPTRPLWSVLAFPPATEQSQDTGLLTCSVQATTMTTWKYRKETINWILIETLCLKPEVR